MLRGLGIVALVCGGLGLQSIVRDESSREAPKHSSALLKVVPPAFTGGYGSFLASLLWIRVGFYYADWALEQRPAQDLRSNIFRVTTLDPEWIDPFETGSMMLSDAVVGDPQGAIQLLKECVRHHPDRWQSRIYLGMALIESGAPTQEIAWAVGPILAIRDSVPEYAREMAATWLAGGTREDPGNRIRSLARIGAARPEYAIRRVVVQQIVRVVERAGLLAEATSRARMDTLYWIIENHPNETALIDRLAQAIVAPPTAPESESSKNP